MDQPRPLFIVIGIVALIAMAAGVYVAVVAESSVQRPATVVQPG